MDKDGDGYIKVSRRRRLPSASTLACPSCAALIGGARVLPQGGEFKGIRETGHFHLPELPVRDLRALFQPVRLVDTHRRLLCQDLKNFGMKKDLWIKRCRLPPLPDPLPTSTCREADSRGVPAASLRRSGLSVCVWVCCSHGNQVVTGTAEEAFDFSDSDKNGALNKKCEPPAPQPNRVDSNKQLRGGEQ